MPGEVVGERGEDHALVVGVVGQHGHMVVLIVTLVEAHVIIHVEGLEALQVVVYGSVVDADGEHRAVR